MAAAAPAAAPAPKPKAGSRSKLPAVAADLRAPRLEAVLYDVATDVAGRATCAAMASQAKTVLRLLFTGGNTPLPALVTLADSAGAAYQTVWDGVQIGGAASVRPTEALSLGQLGLAAQPDSGRPGASEADWFGAGVLTQAWVQLIWSATGHDVVDVVPHQAVHDIVGPGAHVPPGFRIPLSIMFGRCMLYYRQQWCAAAQDALGGGSAVEVLRRYAIP